MNLIVCLKAVPDTGARIEIGRTGLDVKADFPRVISPYDEFAVEEAIRIKERFGGKVTLVNFGPSGEEALRKGVAMGADGAICVKSRISSDSTSAPPLIDELMAARALASVISDMPFDIILCGKESADTGSGITGPALSKLLNIPLVSSIKKLTIFPEEKRAEAEREIEAGIELIECRLPALFTADRGLNEPRYPSLSGIMRAKKEPLKYLTDPGLPEGDYERIALCYPPLKRKGVILKGATKDQVREAVRFLKDEVKVL